MLKNLRSIARITIAMKIEYFWYFTGLDYEFIFFNQFIISRSIAIRVKFLEITTQKKLEIKV